MFPLWSIKMRSLLFAILFCISVNALASDYECIKGTREVYRKNIEKPIMSDDFMVCHEILSENHKIKAVKK